MAPFLSPSTCIELIFHPPVNPRHLIFQPHQVLAGELQLDMCILNLTSSTLTDDSLAAMLREAPSRSIIVLEDVDAIFVSREDQERRSWDGGNGGGNEGVAKTTVSFSGLLNAIDGVAAQEGRIFYMTTVHYASYS
jgi:chaperone BCS1